MPCDYSVRVTLEIQPHENAGRQPMRAGPRKFIVEYDSDGNVLRIKEIKTYEPGKPWERIFHQLIWSGKSHVIGTGNTMIKQVIAAAQAKIEAEIRGDNATP